MRVQSACGRIVAAMLAGGLAVSGCSTLPSSGPTSTDINTALRKHNDIGFSIVDINAAAAATLASLAPMDGGLERLARTGRIDTVGPGDVLTIAVFEVGITLFQGGSGAGQGGQFNPSARATVLDDVMVDATGTIALPYVGRLNVADKTPADVARMIERGLRRSPDRKSVV